MSATRPATLKDFPYPKVSTMEWKITEAQRELQILKRTEEKQLVERINLLRKPQMEETNVQLNRVEAEILSTQAIKSRLQDQITDLEQRLPVVLAQAKQNESDLNAKKKEVEKIKTEVTGIDSEITKTLKTPMRLIKERLETISLLEKTAYQVSDLIGELRWNHPKEETIPSEPEILGKLKKLIDPHPNVVRWRGKS